MASDSRPGLDSRRLVRLMTSAIERCRLNLDDRVVLTEAATGAYAVTAVMAAMAGAKVYAVSANTPYGASAELEQATLKLGEAAGVAPNIRFVREKDRGLVNRADIITNSGQVRPIDACLVSQMNESAVVPLMYESWEYRPGDVDLVACRARKIAVAGHERAPSVC